VPLVSVHEIQGVQISQVEVHHDSRGKFLKSFPSKVLLHELNSVAVSINPLRGTVRGIHFQVEPYSEEKIVQCIQGSTFEVIIDLRPASKSFSKIATFELSAENRSQVYLPKGIAHGFQTLASNTIVHYCLTSSFSPENSYSIDPLGGLSIDWPLPFNLMSEKDANGVTLMAAAQKYSDSLN
jgi:dTDP-4-dehydrorhamnose 3,5-epimerase